MKIKNILFLALSILTMHSATLFCIDSSADYLERYGLSFALHKAAADDNLVAIEALLKKEILVDQRDSSGHTPLHIAVLMGKIASAQLLLNKGAAVNAVKTSAINLFNFFLNLQDFSCYVEPKVCRPIHLAAACGTIVLLKLLVDHGAHINVQDERGQTPLHLAAAAGSKEKVELLLKHGAQIDAKDDAGRIPLHYAAYHNQLEVSRLLLAQGSSINTTDIFEKTPLDLAVGKEHFEILTLLTNHINFVTENTVLDGYFS